MTTLYWLRYVFEAMLLLLVVALVLGARRRDD